MNSKFVCLRHIENHIEDGADKRNMQKYRETYWRFEIIILCAEPFVNHFVQEKQFEAGIYTL